MESFFWLRMCLLVWMRKLENNFSRQQQWSICSCCFWLKRNPIGWLRRLYTAMLHDFFCLQPWLYLVQVVFHLCFPFVGLLVKLYEMLHSWAQHRFTWFWQHPIGHELTNSVRTTDPFSKFYLEIDNESPGRIGRYMGWQMVKAYAENTGASLAEILSKPAAELYQQSKYKSKK